MLRLVLTVLFVLSTSLASMAATAHGTGMATGQFDHASPAEHSLAMTASPCHQGGTCLPEAAMCRWVCSALVAITDLPAPVISATPMRMDQHWPAFPALAGITPPGFEHPPQPLTR